MATSDLKAILERALECFNDPARRASYFELYAPDAVLHGYPGVEPGLDGIREFYRRFWEAFPDCIITAHDMIVERDELACRFMTDATHRGAFLGIPASGKRISVPGITILRFVDGKCVERWSQVDFSMLLTQIGGAPPR